MSKVVYSVPDHLKGCAVSTTAPEWRKCENPHLFELDKCSQKELKYLVDVLEYPLEVKES